MTTPDLLYYAFYAAVGAVLAVAWSLARRPAPKLEWSGRLAELPGAFAEVLAGSRDGGAERSPWIVALERGGERIAFSTGDLLEVGLLGRRPDELPPAVRDLALLDRSGPHAGRVGDEDWAYFRFEVSLGSAGDLAARLLAVACGAGGDERVNLRG